MLFVIGSFFVAYLCVKKLFPCMNKMILMMVCFVVTCYSSNLYYAHASIGECLLVFVYWLILWQMILFYERGDFKNGILSCMLSAFSYTIHMRSLGLVVAVIISCFIFFIRKRVDLKNIILFCVCTIFLIGVAVFIKNIYQGLWYTETGYADVNDYLGQVDKIKMIFSFDGLVNLLYSMCGKIFYLGASTFLLIYVGLVFCIKKGWNLILTIVKKEKYDNQYSEIYIFILLVFLFNFIITCIFTIGKSPRIDHLIYGRYNETVIAPCLTIAVISLISKRHQIRGIFEIMGIQIALSAIVALRWRSIGVSSAAGNASSIGIADLFTGLDFLNSYAFIATGRAIVIFVILYVCSLIVKRRLFPVGLLVLGSTWIYIAVQGYKSDDISRSENQTYIITDAIDKNTEIYYLMDETRDLKYTIWIDCVQFAKPDKTIHVLYDIQELDKIKDEDYLIVNNVESRGNLEESFFYIAENNKLRLLQKAK